jgi:hypothetical protein
MFVCGAKCQEHVQYSRLLVCGITQNLPIPTSAGLSQSIVVDLELFIPYPYLILFVMTRS